MYTFDIIATVKADPEIKTSNNGKQFCRVLLHAKKGYYAQAGDWIDQSFSLNASVVFTRLVEKVHDEVKKGCKVAATIQIGGYKMEDENGEQITRIGYTLQDIEVVAGPPSNGHKPANRIARDEDAELEAMAAARDKDEDIPF